MFKTRGWRKPTDGEALTVRTELPFGKTLLNRDSVQSAKAERIEADEV